VAGSVSRQSRSCDKFLHYFADVGLPCADRHRKLLLSLCVLLGVPFFGCAVCGATALGPNHMRILPWGQVFADASAANPSPNPNTLTPTLTPTLILPPTLPSPTPNPHPNSNPTPTSVRGRPGGSRDARMVALRRAQWESCRG